MAYVLAIGSLKGGVGKTTTAAALGARLTRLGKTVLLVDLDPQGALASALGVEAGNETVRLIRKRAEDNETLENINRIYHTVLLPGPVSGALGLWRADLELATVESGVLAEALRREYVLADLLATARAEWDVILLDCGPSLGLLVVNALTAADAVLIPCAPEFLALQGVVQILGTIGKVRKVLNPGLRLAGIVPTMVQSVGRNLVTHHKGVLEEIAELAAHYGLPLGPPIPRLIAVADAAGQGAALDVYAPNSPATAAYAVLAQQVFSEVLNHA